jgi:hypothetical protein
MLLSRIMFLVGLLFASFAFFLLYFLVVGFFTMFLLGLTGEAVYTIQYGVCLIAGFATAACLMRRGWPKEAKSKPGENTSIANGPINAPPSDS